MVSLNVVVFLHFVRNFLQPSEGVHCTVFVFLFNFIYSVA